MDIKNDILETIGGTPLVRLNRVVDDTAATICGKLERFNPMGSVKDRPAQAMVDAAERDGRLRPGSIIVEPTSGNTGLGLAMVGAVRGYRVILILEDVDTLESVVEAAKALGAEIIATSNFTKTVELAEQFQRDDPRVFMPHQFKNPANPNCHEQVTSQEIIRDAGPRLRAFVAAIGSGGSITGVGRALKAHDPSIEIVLIEPDTIPIVSKKGDVTCSEIHGIGPPFLPETMDPSVVDTIIQVNTKDAMHYMRRLAHEEGILCGPSSGATVFGSIQVARRYDADDVIVVMLPDMGDRYLSEGLFVPPKSSENGKSD